MNFKYKYLTAILIALSFAVQGQDKPIGYWTSLLPYNTCMAAATDGEHIYAVSKEAFFTLNGFDYSSQGYSKVSGMSDIGMQCVAYDKQSNTAILAYTNSNIDLFKNDNFYNIPDLKLKTVAGDKTIYAIYTEKGKAYLSTSLGVVVIDLEEQNFEETYQFYASNQLVAIKGFTGLGNYFYAVTTSGLYRAPKNSPQLQNFQVWERLDSTHSFNSLTNSGSKLYLTTSTAAYVLQSDTVRSIFTSTRGIAGVDMGINKIFIRRFGDVRIMDTNYVVTDSVITADSIMQVFQLADSSIWVCGLDRGVAKRYVENTLFYMHPNGPSAASCYDIYANNKDVWIAHGAYNDAFLATGNGNGFSNQRDGTWQIFNRYNYSPIAYKMYDFVSIVKDETDGTIYAGSFSDGLFELKANDSFKQYKEASPIEISIPNANTNQYPVIGTAIDPYDNLWVAQYGAFNELKVREKATGNWYNFNVSYVRNYPHSGGPMVFDNANHVWYVSSYKGGVIGYDTKNTYGNTADDAIVRLAAGAGAGNLPDIDVRCIAIDHNDNLWVGTANGIGILYNASNCLGQRCDAEIPIVQYDKYAGYLFSGETVQTIAVDGANRKWIGTNNGVWLLSPDAGNSKIIYRFTTDNSPLPSNTIRKIAVDKVTGDVYIGTDKGLVSYRSTATEGSAANNNVLTFPNPVPSDYRGTIAIKGLTENADVRITDINGQLVYRTTALGGQAVWNGFDYKGHRPQSGVYLIFASNTDGSQTYSGKMVFMN